MPDSDPDPDYVTVRRPAGSPFRVISGDLVSDEPQGYDLSLMRSVTQKGLITPLIVRSLPEGRFKVVDGLKRLAVIRILVRTNKLVYDAVRGLTRPARGAFAFVRCRVIRSPKTPADEPTQARPGL